MQPDKCILICNGWCICEFYHIKGVLKSIASVVRGEHYTSVIKWLNGIFLIKQNNMHDVKSHRPIIGCKGMYTLVYVGPSCGIGGYFLWLNLCFCPKVVTFCEVVSWCFCFVWALQNQQCWNNDNVLKDSWNSCLSIFLAYFFSFNSGKQSVNTNSTFNFKWKQT